MASNLGTTLTEVRNIKKKLERPGKLKKKLPLSRLYKSENQTLRAFLQNSCSEKFEKIPMKTPMVVCVFFH